MKLFAPILAGLTLSACTLPDYEVPDQSPSFENFHVRATRVVDFSRPGADSHIVRDILANADLPWRWTLQRPAVKVRIGFNHDMNYVSDFDLPAVTFKDTGPVSIAFTVNDRLLDRVRYETPGPHHFEKPVPSDWIDPHAEAIAAAEIDKVWVSKDDGARLGFILSRIGLVEK